MRLPLPTRCSEIGSRASDTAGSPNIAKMAESVPEQITAVRTDGTVDAWSLELTRIQPQRIYRLSCRDGDGREWAAESSDVFACLMDLRRQVESMGIRLCCNGSRRDAWSSGMQRDMGEGLVVYLLSEVPKGVRAPQVPTLDPIEPSLAVAVGEQEAWYQEWLGPRPS